MADDDGAGKDKVSVQEQIVERSAALPSTPLLPPPPPVPGLLLAVQLFSTFLALLFS